MMRSYFHHPSFIMLLIQAALLISDTWQLHLAENSDGSDFIWPASDSDVTSGGTSAAGGCALCGYAATSKVDRLDAIKNDILRKLRMLAPPNVTSERQLTDIPLLQEFVESANNDVEALQQPHYDDDDHVTNMTVIALSQPGKTSCLFSPVQLLM
jgi:hypothetical protein